MASPSNTISVLDTASTNDTSVFDESYTALYEDATTALLELGLEDNMASTNFSLIAYNLTNRQTGCFRRGALPVALAWDDVCLPGFYCTLKRHRCET